jgi:hypothetical protein
MFVNEQTAPPLDNQQPLERKRHANLHLLPTYIMFCIPEQAASQLDNQQPLVGEEKTRQRTSSPNIY